MQGAKSTFSHLSIHPHVSPSISPHSSRARAIHRAKVIISPSGGEKSDNCLLRGSTHMTSAKDPITCPLSEYECTYFSLADKDERPNYMSVVYITYVSDIALQGCVIPRARPDAARARNHATL